MRVALLALFALVAVYGGPAPPTTSDTFEGNNPSCEFPSFEEPSWNIPRAIRNLCDSTNRALDGKNQLCICQRFSQEDVLSFKEFVQDQCDSDGLDAFLTMNIRAILLAANRTLLSQFGLTTALDSQARMETCNCIKKLRRAQSESRETVQGNCAALIINGTHQVTPQQLFSAASSFACPKIGCCQGLYNLTRRVRRIDYRTLRTINATENVRAGGTTEGLTKAICMQIQNRLKTRVDLCRNSTNPFTLLRSYVSFNESASGSCDAVNFALFGNDELREFGSRINNWASTMCNQDDAFDDSCVDSHVEHDDLGRYPDVNGERDVNLTGTNDSRRSFESDGTYRRVRVTINDLRNRIGRVGARNSSDCDLDSPDNSPNATGEIEYITAQNGGRIRNRLRRVRVVQRLDQSDGELDSDGGEVDCDGVYASSGNSTVRNTILRLRNAGAARGRWRLSNRTVVQCEAALLLNGVEVDGDESGHDAEYSLDCSGSTNGVIVSGARRNNTIRVRVRTHTLQVDADGDLYLDDDAVVTRLATARGSRTVVRGNRTISIRDCDGDGDVEADGGVVEVDGTVLVRTVTVRVDSVFRVGPIRNTSSNRTAAVITTITSITIVGDRGVLEIVGRSAHFSGNASFARGAVWRVYLGVGDGYDRNTSIPLVFDYLDCLFENAANIRIEIEQALYDRFNGSFTLARWLRGNPQFGANVTVVIVPGTPTGMRRRLQTVQTCSSTVVNGNMVVDCSQSAGGASTAAPGSPTKSPTGSGAPGSPTTSPTGGSGAPALLGRPILSALLVMFGVVWMTLSV